MADFLQAKARRDYGDKLRWDDNGCSAPTGSTPKGYNFLDPCRRHDFGYRNYQDQGRFTEANRKRIDDKFKADMNNECNKYSGASAYRGVDCRFWADKYYQAVRACGAPNTPVACPNRYF